MTIEERAKQYAAQSINIGADEMTYRDAASEQRKIDIEKALDWISKHLSRVDGWSEIEGSFRKAMEE